MANITVTNNGDPSLGDPDILITADGFSKTLKAGECVGLDPALIYTVSTQQE